MVLLFYALKKIASRRYGEYMLYVLKQKDVKSFNKVKSEFPYSRILMRIVSLDDG